ncbi:MAG: phosphate acyltransferase PlsX [Gemmatimonadales bacterium]
MTRIALDAMGGDFAPETPIEGAVLALQSLPASHDIVLVGRSADIETALSLHDVPEGRLRVVDAPDVIDMAEKPLQAIRGKRKSSIRIGLEMVKVGEADAFVSGGNTGAMMAGSTLVLGLHPGVDRPAIGALFPTVSQPVLLLDAGANVDCTPRELRGFARLGSVYARDVLQRPQPSVGLLNIGDEAEKGNEAVRGAHALLAEDPGLRFVGNVEGRDIINGDCDVVVCDGFVGNVVLKFYESVARLFGGLLEQEVSAELLQTPGMQRVFKILDYTEYGGAPLLGVRGVSIICHGSSPARAIANAIAVAAQSVDSQVSQHIAAKMAEDGAVP